jgi:hypothetical protein
MSEITTIEQVIVHFLHSVPETWTDHDPTTLSELQERAVYLLTAAGMIERRVTLRLRMVGHPVAVEATITMTGEGGLAQAMGFVLTDIWSEWQETFERHRSGDLKDQPFSHCERVDNEQWRLTEQGVLARRDIENGDEQRVLDFVLKRGFFGSPRLLPDGKLMLRPPVAGKGSLVRSHKITGEIQASVNITNWPEGAKAFAAALEEAFKPKLPSQGSSAVSESDPLLRLLSVYSSRVYDDRMRQAAQILADESLTVHDKLTKIDGLLPFPPTASADQLGGMLGVSKQAVMKTVWWRKNRRGESDEEIERRHAKHKDRGKRIDRPRSDDGEDDR